MNNKLLIFIILTMLVTGGFFVFNSRTDEKDNPISTNDYRNAEFTINGERVKLNNGFAEKAIPNSSSKITTRYFGNELETDLDGDGKEDAAFIITQNSGGSGTFYYAVAALNTDRGYIGSDAYLLGDRIAPQSTNLSQNKNDKYVVVFNYADRAEGEPMTAKATIGKSVYLKLNKERMQWEAVLPDSKF